MQKKNYQEEILNLIHSGLPQQELAERLSDYHENDLADALAALTPEERQKLYAVLGVERVAEFSPTKPTDEAADLTVGSADTSIAGMLCEGRFALYLAGEPYRSGLKAQGCCKLKKAVFSIELDADEEDGAEEE